MAWNWGGSRAEERVANYITARDAQYIAHIRALEAQIAEKQQEVDIALEMATGSLFKDDTVQLLREIVQQLQAENARLVKAGKLIEGRLQPHMKLQPTPSTADAKAILAWDAVLAEGGQSHDG